jgi:hypothetical protein
MNEAISRIVAEMRSEAISTSRAHFTKQEVWDFCDRLEAIAQQPSSAELTNKAVEWQFRALDPKDAMSGDWHNCTEASFRSMNKYDRYETRALYAQAKGGVDDAMVARGVSGYTRKWKECEESYGDKPISFEVLVRAALEAALSTNTEAQGDSQ